MKIEQSSLSLEASHYREHRQSSSLETTLSFRSVLKTAALPAGFAAVRPGVAATADPAAELDEELTRVRQMLQELVAALLDLLSGQNCQRRTPELASLGAELAADLPRPTRVVEWQQTRRETIEEHEQTDVSGRGEVRTSDGRALSFELSLSMCRDYSCTREVSESRRIELKDPLVINFAGQAAELSKQRFSFDLDADGKAELLPGLAAGSGYLAFDADHDGAIASGAELFGATGTHAGDGFADLARLDADTNGWIDEADPAWNALGVWFPDGALKPLKDAGVGALSLASAASPFGLKDDANQTLGQIRRTGIFLAEDGRVGSLQQVDLAAGETPAG